ncbi:MAG: carotenoid biosynthesis protein [Ilumatobacteraceae bacterium]
MLASVVVTGLGSTTLAATTSRWGARRALASLAVVATPAPVCWNVGTQSGGRSGPTASGCPAPRSGRGARHRPGRLVRDGGPGERRRTERSAGAARRSVASSSAAALTAWDLFLDPQMVGEGYWRWERGGRYRGIPWTNFAGWFLASTVLMGALEVALPVDRPDPDPTLVAEYGAMSVMETLGFAAFFRDRLVAVVGGAASAADRRCRAVEVPMARAVIVGGGVGGLAAAIRLRRLGHDVVVLERNEVLGGKSPFASGTGSCSISAPRSSPCPTCTTIASRRSAPHCTRRSS